jgi:ABC-type Zn2+ transport system substrate-binding protein/surface adhesin
MVDVVPGDVLREQTHIHAHTHTHTQAHTHTHNHTHKQILWWCIGMIAVREVYEYTVNKAVKRLGHHAWLGSSACRSLLTLLHRSLLTLLNTLSRSISMSLLTRFAHR